VHRQILRSEFLRLGAAGALGAVLGAPAVASAQTPQGDDVGYVQWGATAEMVSVAFWTRALDDGDFGARATRRLRAARDADREHLRKLNTVLGDDAPRGDDFEIALPARAFRSRERILELGAEIEQRVVGVYLDGVARTTDQESRLLLGRLLVSDTQHLTMLRGRTDGGLRNPIRIEEAGEWLDQFLR
jgi:Ferritin-like domain